MTVESSPPAGFPHTRKFLGLALFDGDIHDLVSWIDHRLRSGQFTRVVPLNPHVLVSASSDVDLSASIRNDGVAVCDGFGISLAHLVSEGSLLRRIPGVELQEELAGMAAQTGRSVFLLGGTDGSAALCAEVLMGRYPRLKVAGIYEPPSVELIGDFDNDLLVSLVKNAAPDMLFVALGIPKQELWLSRFQSILGVPFVMGVGASFDLISGRVARAPRAVRKLGLEWVYRMVREPGRLWKRYLLGIPAFAGLVVREMAGRKRKPPP